jgi:hypothetical protein
VLDDTFAALLSRPLPETWRADSAAMRAEMAADAAWDAIDTRRARLVSERERLTFQHRYGLITDADLLREADRIRLALQALPVRGDDVRDEAAQASAGQTIASLAGSWAAADLSERADLVRLVLLPEGLRYDLVCKQIVAVRPRASFLVPLRLAWNDDWRAQADGWLVSASRATTTTLIYQAPLCHCRRISRPPSAVNGFNSQGFACMNAVDFRWSASLDAVPAGSPRPWYAVGTVAEARQDP